jgi:hypothetical protein
MEQSTLSKPKRRPTRKLSPAHIEAITALVRALTDLAKVSLPWLLLVVQPHEVPAPPDRPAIEAGTPVHNPENR